MKPTVTAYLDQNPRWKELFEELRRIFSDQDLFEAMSGGKMNYSYQGRSVALLENYPEYLALIFPKGILLSDSKNLLQETTTKSVLERRMLFTDLASVKNFEPAIVDFIHQSIEIEKAGVKATNQAPIQDVPLILAEQFSKDSSLEAAFYQLSSEDRQHYHKFLEESSSEAETKKRLDQIIQGVKTSLMINEKKEE